MFLALLCKWHVLYCVSLSIVFYYLNMLQEIAIFFTDSLDYIVLSNVFELDLLGEGQCQYLFRYNIQALCNQVIHRKFRVYLLKDVGKCTDY